MKILFIDNYDSFTHNVVELLRRFEQLELTFVKNDQLEGLSMNDYDGLIISPGPDLPEVAGSLMDFLRKNLELKPALGICLGHQAIGEYYCGSLKLYSDPKHGEKITVSVIEGGALFKDIPKHFEVGLYHSWYVDKTGFPTVLEVTALSEDGIIMAMQHRDLPIYSVQFHPESYMSQYGFEILQNFIRCL